MPLICRLTPGLFNIFPLLIAPGAVTWCCSSLVWIQCYFYLFCFFFSLCKCCPVVFAAFLFITLSNGLFRLVSIIFLLASFRWIKSIFIALFNWKLKKGKLLFSGPIFNRTRWILYIIVLGEKWQKKFKRQKNEK